MIPTSAHHHFQPMRFVLGSRSLEIVATVARDKTDFHGLIDGVVVTSGEHSVPVLALLIRLALAAGQAGDKSTERNRPWTSKSDFGAMIVTMQIG